MSLTRVVPAAVPSLFHSSPPCTPSSAAKNSVPFTSAMLPGDEPTVRVPLMSLTSAVPAAVPSDFHRSDAYEEPETVKNSGPLTFVSQKMLAQVPSELLNGL